MKLALLGGVLSMVVALACGPSSGRVDGGGGGGTDGASGDSNALVADANGCVATENPEVTCNGLDDDCNGRIDDIDVGNDGICDCLRIGIIGQPGQNPSANFQNWLQSRGTTVTRFGLDTAPLTTPMLQQFDVVILDRLTRDYTQAEAVLLKDWVASSGGVMAMSGYASCSGPDRTRPNNLLASIGLSYRANALNGPVTQFTAHPITVGISSVSFFGGCNVDPTGAPGGTDTVVATLGNASVGTAQERQLGHVFVFGDEWIEFDSEWTAQPQIEQFWVNILGWLGPRTSCQIVQ